MKSKVARQHQRHERREGRRNDELTVWRDMLKSVRACIINHIVAVIPCAFHPSCFLLTAARMLFIKNRSANCYHMLAIRSHAGGQMQTIGHGCCGKERMQSRMLNRRWWRGTTYKQLLCRGMGEERCKDQIAAVSEGFSVGPGEFPE